MIPLAGNLRETHPLLKGITPARSLISFFELSGAYIGVRLWTPERLRKKDLLWLATPRAADYLGVDFPIGKHYATSRPTSWMLQEMAPHNLTNNAAIISKHSKGVLGNIPFFGQDKHALLPAHKCGF